MTNSEIPNKFDKHMKYIWDFNKKKNEYNNWEIVKRSYINHIESDNSVTIPKIIHQIWLGSKFPIKYRKWQKSWIEKNKGYEYKLWTEDDVKGFGMENREFFEMNGNYGVKSDIFRYEILQRYGGIYVDTDFECIKPIESILGGVDFMAGISFDYKPVIFNGLIGCKPNHILMKAMIEVIKDKKVVENDPREIMRCVGPQALTDIYFDNLRYLTNRDVIYPSDYFYPWPNYLIKNQINRYDYLTNYSYAIHHWEVSWMKRGVIRKLYEKVRKYN